MAVNLISEHPKTMVPAFDRRQGLRYKYLSGEKKDFFSMSLLFV